MGIRVQYLAKPWTRLSASDLERDLRGWSVRLAAEADRIGMALASGAWSVDTHHDPELESLGKELWRYADQIRRGTRRVYISVVRDAKDPATGRRRIKTLKSFGLRDELENPGAELRAKLYCNMYEGAIQLRRKFGHRKLFPPEVNAIREAYGLALGPEWVACIIRGDEDILGEDEAQQAIDSFTDDSEDEV